MRGHVLRIPRFGLCAVEFRAHCCQRCQRILQFLFNLCQSIRVGAVRRDDGEGSANSGFSVDRRSGIVIDHSERACLDIPQWNLRRPPEMSVR